VDVFVEVFKEENGKKKVLKRKKASSFVKAFIGLLNVQMAQATRTIKDTSGTDRSYGANSNNFAVNAGAGTSTYGIQVGTGTNAVTIDDYKLQTQIAHGTGAGQLQYGATSIDTYTVSSGRAFFNVQRLFTNSSGSDITVREVGLVGLFYSTSYPVLLDRTLIEFTIPNGETRGVNYQIIVSV